MQIKPDQHVPAAEGDILVGAAAIANFLYRDAKLRRKVYYRVERREIPHFYMGGTVCSTRSALMRMIARQMRATILQLEAAS